MSCGETIFIRHSWEIKESECDSFAIVKTEIWHCSTFLKAEVVRSVKVLHNNKLHLKGTDKQNIFS